MVFLPSRSRLLQSLKLDVVQQDFLDTEEEMSINPEDDGED